jgi:3-oxoacyl-[acyl-carrier protein] reductase
MSDRYASFANTGAGRAVVRRLGLPHPIQLRRYAPGEPDLDGAVLVGGSGRLAEPVRKLIDAADTGEPAALVYDATGITTSAGLRGLYDFFAPTVRSLRPCGRVVVLGTPPEECPEPGEAIAQRALEGFVRSVGKELGRGGTANLVYASRSSADNLESPLRFLLSARSAYVSGQVIRVGAATNGMPADPRRPFDGKVAVVTGAARGIGAAIARVLARDGARVVCLDLPAAGDALAAVANDVRGTALQLDLTADDAGPRLVDYLRQRFDRADVVVHNAGITADRTLARMTPPEWDRVIAVNLGVPQRITDAVLEAGLIPHGGRIVALSSVSGIAGNRGQTNYATSKAGIIGFVEALGPALAGRGITVNGVAPGFIETRLTAAMPRLARTVARRLNSLAQGGLPVDVAEAVAWLAAPGSTGVTGQVVRVCGQSLVGA